MIEIKHKFTGETIRAVEADTLAGVILAGADLSGANLNGADLAVADLVGALLVGADLGSANLTGANLESASLVNASLAGANLTGANLAGADLTGANLAGGRPEPGLAGGRDLERGPLRPRHTLSGVVLRPAGPRRRPAQDDAHGGPRTAAARNGSPPA